MDLNFLQYVKSFIELGNNDRIFAVDGNDYINGDFNIENDKNFISSESYNTLKKDQIKYFYRKFDIDNEAYYIAILSLRDYKNDYVGNFGVAVSRKEFLEPK